MKIKELKIPVRAEPNFEAQDDIIQPETYQVEQAAIVFKDKVPAHWAITPCEFGITAINVSSRETFEGSMPDFNKLLKG